MVDIDAFVKNEPIPDISLVPDCAFPVYRGEKGICRALAVSRESFELIRDFSGGEAFNIVLGKASVSLPYSAEFLTQLGELCKQNKRLTLERSDSELILCAQGISKHAALPDGSLNAALILSEALLDSGILPESDRKLLEAVRTLLKAPETVLGVCATDSDFGRTTVANGIVSIRDRKLELSLDVRFVQTDGAALLDIISSKLDSLGFVIEPKRLSPGFKISEDDPNLRRLLQVWSELTGESSPKACLNAGGTYSRHLKNAFSIGTSLGNPAPCPLPSGHGGVHQPDEYLNIDAHLSGIAIIAEMLIALDSEENYES